LVKLIFSQESGDKSVGLQNNAKTPLGGAGYIGGDAPPHHTPHNVSRETLVNIFYVKKIEKKVKISPHLL